MISLVAVVILVAGIVLLINNEDNQYQEKRGNMTEGFGQLKTVEIGGVKYREKPAVTTLLICGIDVPTETDDVSEATYRNAGPADFLLLLGIDHTDKKIHQLQIDRDTMAEIDILGVFGNEVGTRVWQICLSHSYGKTPQDNAKYTVRAVERLLGGIEVDGYYMIDYTAMGTINDALGGVPVKRICRVPEEDAASVGVIASSCSSVSSCASSNTTRPIPSKPRAACRDRAENSMHPPFVSSIASSPFV